MPGNDGAAAAPAALPPWRALFPDCLAAVPMCCVASAIIPAKELSRRRLCAPSLRAEFSENVVAGTYLAADLVITAHSARNEGLQRNLRQCNSCMGMIAAKHMGTTARQSGSNASHGGIAAEADSAPSLPGNPGQLPEASNCFFYWRPRDVGRGCLATMVQQWLLLRHVRGFRCFRIFSQWSVCFPLRPQSFRVSVH